MSSHVWQRVDLAIEQLETALSLFLDQQRYASAITLAGAAELVLGQTLGARGKIPVLDWQFSEVAPVHLMVEREPLNKGKYVDAQNRVYRALKHYNFARADGPTFEADLQEAACWMLVRACENAHRLDLTVTGFDTFNDWFYTHVVGV
ncbi:hypothetical protein WJ41_13950 [Burkholderia ubonensis]|uniref:hypothetical protein n=1 Tax=Burkholderia ubonensis TaxID=101571 RepID=UPI00075E96C9|nr:hypothetical protein [Burkholderia ubonensis]KVH72229.1 hypothetical protein WJ41_13950 [Burkholderia ubonensis]KVU04746.1 hypothetical protein WK61_02505 [Burkholderia ubonensis]